MEDAVYKEFILDLYRRPRNKGVLSAYDVAKREFNPSCGDHITVYVKFGGDGTIEDISHDGQGCAISTASASLLTDFVKGKTLDEVKKLNREDVFSIIGVPLSPARVKCALLALKIIKGAVYAHLGEKLAKEEG